MAITAASTGRFFVRPDAGGHRCLGNENARAVNQVRIRLLSPFPRASTHHISSDCVVWQQFAVFTDQLHQQKLDAAQTGFFTGANNRAANLSQEQ